MTPTELAADLRTRINPLYATQIGTESYERRLCAEAIEGLLATVAERAAAKPPAVLINQLVNDKLELSAKLAERDAEIGLLNGTLDSRNRNIETLSEVSAAQRKVLEQALEALNVMQEDVVSTPNAYEAQRQAVRAILEVLHE